MARRMTQHSGNCLTASSIDQYLDQLANEEAALLASMLEAEVKKEALERQRARAEHLRRAIAELEAYEAGS